jgi:hypothetical protein
MMSIERHIHWHDDAPVKEGQRFANVHLLFRTEGSLADYQAMAVELRQTFPQALDSELGCEKIRTPGHPHDKSRLLTWNAYIPEGEYPQWSQYVSTAERPLPKYFW